MFPRVLVVAEHATTRFGGEAALAFHYFRVLTNRGVPVWLLVHERSRSDLESYFGQNNKCIIYVRDTLWHRLVWLASKVLPARFANFTTGFVLRFITQAVQRSVIRRMSKELNISVIHQPMPVSPREPSLLFDLMAPVVIGPMNGGMDYPQAFKPRQNCLIDTGLAAGRALSYSMNCLIPGKKRAAVLLVANERTHASLPRGLCRRVETVVENGVDLSVWRRSSAKKGSRSGDITHFVFVGRLVDWKAVDLLLLAFRQAAPRSRMSLTIIGNGAEKANLEKLSQDLELLGSERAVGKVCFLGWMDQMQCAEYLQRADALVLPSLLECGGAVVLEAMAMELPVIATKWGGPAEYIDPSCGILVEPASKESFVQDFSDALVRLAKSPQERFAMGQAGRDKVLKQFDWEAKIDSMLAIYRSVVR
jgi:glycosyltransferase involved in cell wall biosynthesis